MRIFRPEVVRWNFPLLVLFFALSLLPNAFAAGKISRVGVILPDDEWKSSVDGLIDGMKGLGYIDGASISYQIDNAKGDKARILATTNKFVDSKFDVIYTVTNTGLQIVTEATRATKTPVVFGSASGPVESGLVKGYATPDTHVTGVTSGSLELVPKRLEILRDMLPKVTTIALIGDAEAGSSKAAFKLAAEIAPTLGLRLTEIRIKSKEDAVEGVKKLARQSTDAIFLLPGLFSVGSVPEVAIQAKSARIPFAVYQAEHIKIRGALLSYGSSYYHDGKQSATLVVKVLQGTQPAQLPIERPQGLKLIVNLATAKDIGVSFSAVALSGADEVIPASGK